MRDSNATGPTDKNEGESFEVKTSIYDEDEERDGFQHRKLYPQRHNRTKLNYRDLERGMYEEIRQNIWNQGNPLPSSKFDRHGADETQPMDPDLSVLSNESLVTLTSQTVKRESSNNRLSNSASKIFGYPTSSADASAKSSSHCNLLDCQNRRKPDTAYCSKRCIRHHVNRVFQSIKRFKSTTNGEYATTRTLAFRDVRTKAVLEKRLFTNADELYQWLIHHRSQTILATMPVASSSSTDVSSHSKTSEIRSKVPKALYDKLAMRLEKSGEWSMSKEDVEVIANGIEEEMFRVYKKTDNAYKNKFRSLLANISNMNNDFFYRQILSRRWTAQEIVALKPEDMLPPKEKERRKDEFQREVQLIIASETHATLVAAQLDHTIDKEQDEAESAAPTRLDVMPSPSLESQEALFTSAVPSTTPLGQSLLSNVDGDNDYIEPESPTGIDALIYDDDDENEDDDDNHSSSSATSSTRPPVADQPIRPDDNNRSKCANLLPYTTTPQWRGMISSSDILMHCQSKGVYGENLYLLEHLPEQLDILGRLRAVDLWYYVRDSLTVRDIMIITLIPSLPLSPNNQEVFSQYLRSMREGHRAAVLTKPMDPSFIRDMYLLPAETIDCPSLVASTFALPRSFERNQFFLIVIGATKRSIKTMGRTNDYESANSLIYKPIILQETTIVRDPRLAKHRDSQIGERSATAIQTSDRTREHYSTEDLQKLMNETFAAIRQAPSVDAMQPTILSLLQIFKDHQREDLSLQFTKDLRSVIAEWESKRESNRTTSTVLGDNLVEENMEVDEEQEDCKRKDSEQAQTTLEANPVEPARKERKRKSRFSDTMPTPQDRLSAIYLSRDPNLLKTGMSTKWSIARPSSQQCSIRTAPVTLHNTISTAPLNSKFRPVLNMPLPDPSERVQSPSSTVNSPMMKPSRHQPDQYEVTTKLFDDLIHQIQTHGYEKLSFQNSRWVDSRLPRIPLRTEATVNLLIHQQKAKQRSCSTSAREWKSTYTNHSTHYHDFDRPEE